MIQIGVAVVAIPIATFYLVNVATSKVLEIPFLKTEYGENSYSHVV